MPLVSLPNYEFTTEHGSAVAEMLIRTEDVVFVRHWTGTMDGGLKTSVSISLRGEAEPYLFNFGTPQEGAAFYREVRRVLEGQ
jgi:hypothetical protein